MSAIVSRSPLGDPQGQRRPRFSFSDSLVKERRIAPETRDQPDGGHPHETRLPDLENRGTEPTIGGPSQRFGASRAPSPPCQPGQSSEPDRPTRQNSIQETKTADHPAKAGSSIRNISEMTGQPAPPVPKDPLAAADEQASRDPIPARQRPNDEPMRFSRRLRDRRA